MRQRARQEAFDRILGDALRATAHDEVLVIFDESSSHFMDALSLALVARTIPSTFLFLPVSYQAFLCERLSANRDVDWLPTALKRAFGSSSAVLNCLNGDIDTAILRRAIIHLPKSLECRFAHIPGLTDDVLDITRISDFGEILEHAELLAWHLGNATKAVVYSGRPMRCSRLEMSLGGWENEPLMSPGLLLPGGWGNLPPGEVFCCPDAASVSGEVYIDGSLPGLVLRDAEGIALRFEEGVMVNWSSDNGEGAKAFFDRLENQACARGDDNWNRFAELGIGLNRFIVQLTGNPLFDEKAARTMHFALGDNTVFGASIRSDVHIDMVSQRPSLELDGELIMRDGLLDIDRLRQRRHGWPSGKRVNPNSFMRLKEAQIAMVDGRIKRRLCRAGRIGHVDFGDVDTSDQLASLTAMLKRIGVFRVQDFLEDHPKIKGGETGELLSLLYHYDCLLEVSGHASG